MLRIVHSNINTGSNEGHICTDSECMAVKSDLELANEGYKKALVKNADLIAEIQVYYPGWMPEFRYPY